MERVRGESGNRVRKRVGRSQEGGTVSLAGINQMLQALSYYILGSIAEEASFFCLDPNEQGSDVPRSPCAPTKPTTARTVDPGRVRCGWQRLVHLLKGQPKENYLGFELAGKLGTWLGMLASHWSKQAESGHCCLQRSQD